MLLKSKFQNKAMFKQKKNSRKSWREIPQQLNTQLVPLAVRPGGKFYVDHILVTSSWTTEQNESALFQKW